MARKVAIVAKAATAAFAPYDDPTWEIWGIPWVRYRRTPDLLFDLHSDECWQHLDMPEDEKRDWERRVNEEGTAIYCHPSRCYLFRNAKPFPYHAILNISPIPYFENSIAYQLAFAAWSHEQGRISEISLCGVNMMGTREYLWERASVTYWVGYLLGKGINVTTPEGSALFMSYWTAGRYGETSEKRFQL